MTADVPRLLVLTDRRFCGGSLVDTVATAVVAGARAVVLREKDLPVRPREDLATELAAILDPVGGILIKAGPAGAAGLAGERVHLAAQDPFPRESRPVLVGRSCHDVGELAAATTEGCDYVTLSPVFVTGSKPGYGPALGPAGLARIIHDRALIYPAGRRESPPPLLYALGGVLPADVADCLAAGAHGIAAMGPLMRDPYLVADYLDALAHADPANEPPGGAAP